MCGEQLNQANINAPVAIHYESTTFNRKCDMSRLSVIADIATGSHRCKHRNTGANDKHAQTEHCNNTMQKNIASCDCKA
jgi:hypothetical protein